MTASLKSASLPLSGRCRGVRSFGPRTFGPEFLLRSISSRFLIFVSLHRFHFLVRTVVPAKAIFKDTHISAHDTTNQLQNLLSTETALESVLPGGIHRPLFNSTSPMGTFKERCHEIGCFFETGQTFGRHISTGGLRQTSMSLLGSF